MSIVSSIFIAGHAQIDGRRYVVEEHTDHVGTVHRREYGPVEDSVDKAALLVVNAVQLVEQLAEQEFADRITAVKPLALDHQTAAAFAARLRERYRSMEREDLARIADWILDQITAGHITDLQVRNAFGLTTTQYNALKARMTNLQTNWLAVQAARGE